MNIILLNKKTGRSWTLGVGPVPFLLLGLVLVMVFAGIGYLGYMLTSSYHHKSSSSALAEAWSQDIEDSSRQLTEARREANEHFTALTVRLAEIQGSVMRLDALGERLLKLAELDEEEFDFSRNTPVGGPRAAEEGAGYPYRKPEFIQVMDSLSADIMRQEEQLKVLERLMVDRKLKKGVYLSGRPVEWGWMSSRFGRRTDPFNGRLAWHNGIDFAGKDGSNIISVGSGVVIWSGDRHGYGLMVEINHGGGLVTRYAHAKALMVKVGDIVSKGQTIALMGSTGRSTGPHVHFEVRYKGKPIDPAPYVNRTRG